MRNPCKECDYYNPENNTCRKKCATMGNGYVTFIDRLFCEPYKADRRRERMSRTIDADALIEELNNSHFPGAPYVDAGISIAIGKVCDTPTIEPERKTGKWILQDGGKATCPFCRYTFRDVWDDDSCDSFCRRCGAMLEGER